VPGRSIGLVTGFDYQFEVLAAPLMNASVPEPMSVSLMFAGAGAALALARRRQRRDA
jgi:hypothetical protein